MLRIAGIRVIYGVKLLVGIIALIINVACAGLSIKAILATTSTFSSCSTVVTYIHKEKLESGECIVHVTKVLRNLLGHQEKILSSIQECNDNNTQ